MEKKILIVCLALLSIVVLSGCEIEESKADLCRSMGYSDWNWYDRLSDNRKFFCYHIDCDDNITTSKLFIDFEDAKRYRSCNYKPKSELLCN